MKVKIFQLPVLLVISLFFGNCSENKVDPIDISGKDTLEISFDYGTSPTSYKNIYAIWIQNQNSVFIQNLRVCPKLLNGSLTGTALPFWKTKVYPNSQEDEIDAVSAATIANSNFTIVSAINNSEIKQFKVFFEIDRSFDPNDWFGDQPALLYSADIDLESNVTDYELTPCGWTPNEGTQNVISGTPMGTLQPEMKYITNLKNGTSFGGIDSRRATIMVDKITLKVR
jgi:hypothetical protein